MRCLMKLWKITSVCLQNLKNKSDAGQMTGIEIRENGEFDRSF